MITSTTTAGQPIIYPKTQQPEVKAIQVEIPPGVETGWHTHPFPIYAYVLTGELTVEVAGGKRNIFKTGDVILEAVDLPHNGKNVGVEPVKLILFVTGQVGKLFTVKTKRIPSSR